MRRPILNHTRTGEACYDPFLGSGSTLIAAESSQTNLLRLGDRSPLRRCGCAAVAGVHGQRGSAGCRRPDLRADRSRASKETCMSAIAVKKPPRRNLGGRGNGIADALRLQRVATLPIVAFRIHLQTHAPAEHTGNESAHRMSLPTGRFHEIRPGSAAGTLQQLYDFGGLAPSAGYGGLLGGLGGTRSAVGLLRPTGLLGRLSAGRRNASRVSATVGLFGWNRLLHRVRSLQIRSCFWHFSHFSLSLGGDYRDHMSPSPCSGMHAKSRLIKPGSATW